MGARARLVPHFSANGTASFSLVCEHGVVEDAEVPQDLEPEGFVAIVEAIRASIPAALDGEISSTTLLMLAAGHVLAVTAMRHFGCSCAAPLLVPAALPTVAGDLA
jgi:hypothetical protein